MWGTVSQAVLFNFWIGNKCAFNLRTKDITDK